MFLDVIFVAIMAGINILTCSFNWIYLGGKPNNDYFRVSCGNKRFLHGGVNKIGKMADIDDMMYSCGLEILHPGGLEKTDDMARMCKIGRGKRVLDPEEFKVKCEASTNIKVVPLKIGGTYQL